MPETNNLFCYTVLTFVMPNMLIMVDEQKSYFGENYGRLPFSTRDIMIRSSQGQGIFTNALSSILKTVNLKIFPSHEEVYP